MGACKALRILWIWRAILINLAKYIRTRFPLPSFPGLPVSANVAVCILAFLLRKPSRLPSALLHLTGLHITNHNIMCLISTSFSMPCMMWSQCRFRHVCESPDAASAPASTSLNSPFHIAPPLDTSDQVWALSLLEAASPVFHTSYSSWTWNAGFHLHFTPMRLSKEPEHTLSPAVSSFRVIENLEKLYLVWNLDGLLRFQRNWASDDNCDPFPFPFPEWSPFI